MRKIVLYFILLVIVSGCKKYEEGPSLSLRSKKSRIAGEWKINYATFNEVDFTSDLQQSLGTDYVLHLEKDGTFHEKGSFENKGTWKLGHEKAYLLMLSDIPGSEEKHLEILKLKNKEFWVRHTHDTHITEIHYIQ
ncbi:MAG: hypothetical protein ACHQF2_00040 [Flavobacteriales bacterium]